MGRGEIYLAVDMAHTADKIAVGGGNTTLTGGEYAHISSKAGAAGGGGNNGARVDKSGIPAPLYTVSEYLHGSRDDYTANTFGNLFTV